MGNYPQMVVDLKKLKHNMERSIAVCRDQGISVAGVIKGCSGLPQVADEYAKAGAKYIASSRLEQIQAAVDFGVQAEFMMIRLPMKSEAADVVRLTSISLNSEVAVLEELDLKAGLQGKKHKVILMADLGDLREGFWDKEELLAAALKVENNLSNLELAGVGTNLGCYGAVSATTEKLDELVACAEKIEAKIGRELEFISGGATTSLPRIYEDNMPKRINLLRLGEGVILAKDLQDLWGYDMSDYYQNAFTLQAEVIEVRNKPSYPVGEIMFDAFGDQPTYEDRGIRKRVLLALGKADYAFPELILPRDEGVEILGASSDHTIVDVEEASREFQVGDIMEFDLCYASLVYTTNSPNIKKKFV